MNAPSIQLHNLTLQWQHQVLFNHLDFILKADRWTVVLGPSGVGKSSLLKILCGLISPLQGEIKTSDHISLSGRIAYMAQQDGLLPWLSAFENAILGAHLRGEVTPAQTDKAQQLLIRVGLENAFNKKPEQLSGGMRQRVALVRTLMEDAPVVLLDEPFSATDAITRAELQNLAAELLKDKTVLLITHDPLEAVRLGNDIYLMSGFPAVLESMLHLDDEIPRHRDDMKVLQWQAQIWKKLSTNSSI